MTVLKLLYLIIILFTSVHSLPNFVVLLADDLGFGDVGCFGNDSIKTPNIDKLALNGVKLNHHLAAAAVCTPSRAALLTGRYPIRSGMESSNRNKVFFFAAASGGLPENETSIAKALKSKNYSTALIGKWHLGNDCQSKGDGCHHPLNHGFDYFYGLPISNFKDLGNDGGSVITTYIPNFYPMFILIPIIGIHLSIFTFRSRTFLRICSLIFLVLIPLAIILFLKNLRTINGILMENMEVIEQPIRLTGLTQNLVGHANSFLEQHKNEPFFLFVSFVHVHTALFCSKEFAGKSQHGAYGDNVEELDWAVGEITSTLKKLGLSENTFVYFSSDNGGHVEEYGVDGQREGGYNGNLRGGKTIAGFEGGIRVPTIISWSESVAKLEINQTTSQMDLFPTILQIAGIPQPKDRIIDGKSLVPLLKNQTTQSQHKYLFHYCGRLIHAATVIEQGGKKIWKVHWITPKFIPGTERCGYVCHCFGDFIVHHNPPLLYDLLNDVSESNPLTSQVLPGYQDIISKAEEARSRHLESVENVPDQFSFGNTIWKPWLQPCCNFPVCRCTDPNFINVE